MSTTSSSSNVTTPQLPVSDDRTTPESGSSLSSSSILAIPAAAVVVEEMVNHPLQEEATIEQSPNKPSPRYADIGINLTDPTFSGIYHGKKCHEPDLVHVLGRGRAINCLKMIVTGSDLSESEKAVELAETHPGVLYATVGVHPCSAQKFITHPNGPSSLLASLSQLARRAKTAGRCVAFGEIGLDYDRLFLCPKDIQLQYFEAQLLLATQLQLPLFLHSRAASDDFERCLKKYLDRLPKRGVVHSFTGELEEMRRLVALGFDIGVNGCSLKTDENLDVVKEIPLDRIQLETDGPWCEMRASHASAKYLLPPVTATPTPKSESKTKMKTDTTTTTTTATTTLDNSRSHEKKKKKKKKNSNNNSNNSNNNGNDKKGKEEGEELVSITTTPTTPTTTQALLLPPRLPKSVKKEKWDKDCMVKGRWEPVGIRQVAWVVAQVKGISIEELTDAAWKNSVCMFGLGEKEEREGKGKDGVVCVSE